MWPGLSFRTASHVFLYQVRQCSFCQLHDLENKCVPRSVFLTLTNGDHSESQELFCKLKKLTKWARKGFILETLFWWWRSSPPRLQIVLSQSQLESNDHDPKKTRESGIHEKHTHSHSHTERIIHANGEDTWLRKMLDCQTVGKINNKKWRKARHCGHKVFETLSCTMISQGSISLSPTQAKENTWKAEKYAKDDKHLFLSHSFHWNQP